MKNLRKILAMLSVVAIVCANVGVLAEPEEDTQEKYGNSTNKIISTVNNDEDDNEGETKNETSSKSSKATEKTEKKTTVKATEKTSEKKTEKATEKTSKSTKSTEKDTEKTEKKSESKTVATIKPTEKSEKNEEKKETEKAEKKEKSEKDEKEEAKDEEVGEKEDEKEKDKERSAAIINNGKNAEQINAKKFLTKTGAFGMFLLTVLVSAIVSFLISYRFYKMKKTDNYLSSEIRALKRDIDSKMAGLVNNVSEYETRTDNSNPDYSDGDRSLEIEEQTDSEEEAIDMYSKWERQINSRDSEKQDSLSEDDDVAEYMSRAERNRRDVNQRNDRLSRTRKNSKFGNSKGRGTYPDRFSRDK